MSFKLQKKASVEQKTVKVVMASEDQSELTCIEKDFNDAGYEFDRGEVLMDGARRAHRKLRKAQSESSASTDTPVGALEESHDSTRYERGFDHRQ